MVSASVRTPWLAGLLGGVLGSGITAAVVLLALPGRAPVEIPAVDQQPSAPKSPIASAPVPAASAPIDTEALAALERSLADAAAERSQIVAAQLDLSRELDALDVAVSALSLPTGGTTSSDAATTDPEGAPFQRGRGGRFGQRGAPDPEQLIAAGLDPATAASLTERSNAWQLERLQLIDRASREGWGESDELEQQLETLDESRPNLREELGDDAYDRYLFENGDANRVGIASVIPGSAAAAAGIEPGDVILSYATERMFSLGELQGATRAGSLGEIVTVEVLRDGQDVSLSLPRGPLGVTLTPQRVEP